MSEPTPVDSGGEQPPSDQTPDNNTNSEVDRWKSEAHRAFEKRDEAKAKSKQLETELAAFKSLNADAGDDTQKTLIALQAERDELRGALSETKSKHREHLILSSLIATVPEDSREAVKLLYKAQSATLDDGEASPDEVTRKADAFLRQIAPQLFKPVAVPREGRLPNDGGAPVFDAEKARAEHANQLRSLGATGYSL